LHNGQGWIARLLTAPTLRRKFVAVRVSARQKTARRSGMTLAAPTPSIALQAGFSCAGARSWTALAIRRVQRRGALETPTPDGRRRGFGRPPVAGFGLGPA